MECDAGYVTRLSRAEGKWGANQERPSDPRL